MTTVTGIGFYIGTTHEAEEIFDAGLAQTARILDGLMTRESIESNRQQLETALERAAVSSRTGEQGDIVELGHKYEKNLFFIVRDVDEKLLLKSHYAPDLASTKSSSGFARVELNNNDWDVFTLRATHDDLWIMVGERSDVREEITEYIANALIIPVVFILPLALLLLWYLVGVALKPIHTVVDQVRKQDMVLALSARRASFG